MISDKTGKNNQLVTTWGRDLEGDLWVGPQRAMSWTCTCRCGTQVSGQDYGTFWKVEQRGWLTFGKGKDTEAFCSGLCAFVVSADDHKKEEG